MLEKHLSGLPVVDKEGHLKGIICQSDLMAQQRKIPLPSFFILLNGTIPLTSSHHIESEIKKMAAVKVSEAMTPDPLTVDPDTGVEDIATLMVKYNIHTVPVLERGWLVGIMARRISSAPLCPAQRIARLRRRAPGDAPQKPCRRKPRRRSEIR